MSKEIHGILAGINIRIFAIKLGGTRTGQIQYWIAENKSVEEWRKDVAYMRDCVVVDSSGYSDDLVWNDLYTHMKERGYEEIDDVIADVFEGRIANTRSKLIDDPDHEEQKDGFGHYGWESK